MKYYLFVVLMLVLFACTVETDKPAQCEHARINLQKAQNALNIAEVLVQTVCPGNKAITSEQACALAKESLSSAKSVVEEAERIVNKICVE